MTITRHAADPPAADERKVARGVGRPSGELTIAFVAIRSRRHRRRRDRDVAEALVRSGARRQPDAIVGTGVVGDAPLGR